jgi:hypothetical protein
MDIDETTERVQPGPLRWIRYVYGAGLPERYRTWVLHDVTAHLGAAPRHPLDRAVLASRGGDLAGRPGRPHHTGHGNRDWRTDRAAVLDRVRGQRRRAPCREGGLPGGLRDGGASSATSPRRPAGVRTPPRTKRRRSVVRATDRLLYVISTPSSNIAGRPGPPATGPRRGPARSRPGRAGSRSRATDGQVRHGEGRSRSRAGGADDDAWSCRGNTVPG